ncbi:MAG: hypothetical protein F4023_07840 [Acidobacteria bacterium]|nr:hypothetical protein [Acidobacteriota bacterium]MYK79547.1 hypothetical protein [Acidobacteriota bacterium]
MPDSEAGLTGRGFRTRWVLLSGVGMAVAAAAARPLSYVVGEAVGGVLGDVPVEAAIGAVAGGGVLGGIAFAQWFLLRGRVPWAGRWPAALALAGAAAAAAGFAADEALLPGAPPPAPLAFGAAAFVLVHWFLLREQIARAGWLAAATAGAFWWLPRRPPAPLHSSGSKTRVRCSAPCSAPCTDGSPYSRSGDWRGTADSGARHLAQRHPMLTDGESD